MSDLNNSSNSLANSSGGNQPDAQRQALLIQPLNFQVLKAAMHLMNLL